MLSDLNGKGVLITGASSGIGAALAKGFACEGALVAIHYNTGAKEAQAIADTISRKGGKAVLVQGDLGEAGEARRVVDEAARALGRLDVLVNNAGSLIKRVPFCELDTETYEKAMNLNVRAVIEGSQAAAPHMDEQGGGTIINIASVVGFKGYPNQSAYTASKHGIMGLTKALAVEAQQHGIRVSAVLPRGVDTALATSARPDLKREELLRPDDIARTVLFLLSLPENAAL